MNAPMFCKLSFLEILRVVLAGMPECDEKVNVWVWFEERSAKYKGLSGFLDAVATFQKTRTINPTFFEDGLIKVREMTPEEKAYRAESNWLDVATSDVLRNYVKLPRLNWEV